MKAPSFGLLQLFTMVSRQGGWADTGRVMAMDMDMVMELVMGTQAIQAHPDEFKTRKRRK